MLEKSFEQGKLGTTLFIKNKDKHMCKEFSKLMKSNLEMSTMGELNFFLGLHIKQMNSGTFNNRSKYCKEILKMFGMENSKSISTLMGNYRAFGKDKKINDVKVPKYLYMIRSLLYLTTSRLDIMFSVCMCVWLKAQTK